MGAFPAVAAAVLILASAALIGFAVYQLLPERVLLLDKYLLKKHKGKTERMALSDISKIDFHYHAVAGFIGIWEFIDTAGNAIQVDARAKGIEKLITGLESELPGFSQAGFNRKFKEGDVEDSIEVWRKTPATF